MHPALDARFGESADAIRSVIEAVSARAAEIAPMRAALVQGHPGWNQYSLPPLG
ncbi:MAG: hypothetical protein WCI61_00120 [Chloroflexota bacterium]